MTNIQAQTFQPSEIQAMWVLDRKLWNNLQVRGLLNGTPVKVKSGRNARRLIMNVVQAAAFGVQAALIREASLDYRAAHRLASEARVEIKKLFATLESVKGKSIMYAVTTGKENPHWIPVKPDTFVSSINESLEGRPWIVVDVMYYVNTVCEAIANRNDPEGYHKWQAERKAARN